MSECSNISSLYKSLIQNIIGYYKSTRNLSTWRLYICLCGW